MNATAFVVLQNFKTRLFAALVSAHTAQETEHTYF